MSGNIFKGIFFIIEQFLSAFHNSGVAALEIDPLECDHRQRYRYYALVARERWIPASIIHNTLTVSTKMST